METVSASPRPAYWQANLVPDSVFAKLTSLEGEVNQLYEHVPFGTHVLDADGTYLHINALALEWLGYSREQIIGKRKWTEFLTQASLALLQQHRPDPGADGVLADLELDMARSDGTRFPVSVSSVAIVNNNGKLLMCLAVMADLRERAQSTVDQLVAATAFESLSAMFIADRNTTILRINHAFTLLTGYTAQWAVGRPLRRLRSGPGNKLLFRSMRDSLAQHRIWQGEICGERNDGQIYTAALSISSVLDATGAVTHYIGSAIDVSTSRKAEAALVQFAYFDALTKLPNRRLLLDRCTQALAAAKRSGMYGALLFIDLDHFKWINDNRGHEAGDWLLVETPRRLRNAVRESDSVARLGGDEFVVLLEGLDTGIAESAAQAKGVGEKILLLLDQPFTVKGYELHCSASIGVEQVAPAAFIPLAEESGLILPIGQWVLETACARLKMWESNALACDLQMAVNVSALQFRRGDFVASVQQVLQNSGVNPALLELEVTESTVLDVDDTIAKMHALRKLGVKFSMDDFGTGHSSLSSLARLPLSQLKIDQSFVGSLGVQPTAAIIVQAIVAMANELDMAVIAEGVETAAQRAILEQHGVQVFQGYYFGRPVPIASFEGLLRGGQPLLPE